MSPGGTSRRPSARSRPRQRLTERIAVPADPAGRTMSGIALLVLFLVALGIRLIHLWQISGAPFFVYLLGDSKGYDKWARRLASGDWIGSGVFYQAPLYPYVLGLLYAVFGHAPLVIRLVQAVAGAASCVIIALAGTRWFGWRAGLAGGLLLAAYAPAIYFDALVQKSVLDGLLLTALLLALSRQGDRTLSLTQAAVMGVLLGLLALSRENAIVLLPVVFAVIWRAGQRRLPGVLAGAAAMALVLAPVAIRNTVVGGEFHLTTSQLGPNFYIGNSATATGTYVPLKPDHGSFVHERQDATDLAEAATGRRLSPAEVSDYWLSRGLDWIRSTPGAWLRLTARKVMLVLNATEAADTEDIATHAEWSAVLRGTAAVLHFGTLAPLAFFGFWITRSQWRRLWPLYGGAASLAASVVVFYVLDRYRYPIVPILVLFAGVALVKGPAAWRACGRAERTGCLALLTAAIALCNWPLQSATDMHAVTHYNMGVALAEAHREEFAEAEYRAAIALQPSLADPHASLGALLGERGDYAYALSECYEAVRLAPVSPSAHVNLGVVLGSLGRLDQSATALRRALELDPQDADAHYNLAKALAGMGRPEAAIGELRETIRFEPTRAMAHNNLGVLLCQQGRVAEGVAQLQAAVRLDPDSQEAAANLEHAVSLAQPE
jgi:Tfp pilus assembly protein PilF